MARSAVYPELSRVLSFEPGLGQGAVLHALPAVGVSDLLVPGSALLLCQMQSSYT